MVRASLGAAVEKQKQHPPADGGMCLGLKPFVPILCEQERS